jgi:hypothetical protein
MTGQLETPREGLMNTGESFPSVMKPRFIDPKRKKPIRLKVMLASLVTLWTIYMAPRPSFALRAAMWNLHTTQPNTLFPTYDEVVNLTSLLETQGMSVSSGKQ